VPVHRPTHVVRTVPAPSHSAALRMGLSPPELGRDMRVHLRTLTGPGHQHPRRPPGRSVRFGPPRASGLARRSARACISSYGSARSHADSVSLVHWQRGPLRRARHARGPPSSSTPSRRSRRGVDSASRASLRPRPRGCRTRPRWLRLEGPVGRPPGFQAAIALGSSARSEPAPRASRGASDPVPRPRPHRNEQGALRQLACLHSRRGKSRLK
jgi:hypothetical protein